MTVAKISLGFSELPSKIAILVYTQGCTVKCKGCFNTELWPFETKNSIRCNSPEELERLIKSTVDISICGKNPWIVWLGGDPLDQKDIVEVLKYFKEHGYNNCVYTGRTDESSSIPDAVKYYSSLMKIGPWEGIPVTDESSNQYFAIPHFDADLCELEKVTWKNLAPLLKQWKCQ